MLLLLNKISKIAFIILLADSGVSFYILNKSDEVTLLAQMCKEAHFPQPIFLSSLGCPVTDYLLNAI